MMNFANNRKTSPLKYCINVERPRKALKFCYSSLISFTWPCLKVASGAGSGSRINRSGFTPLLKISIRLGKSPPPQTPLPPSPVANELLDALNNVKIVAR
jgi:hypothetical protein